MTKRTIDHIDKYLFNARNENENMRINTQNVEDQIPLHSSISVEDKRVNENNTTEQNVNNVEDININNIIACCASSMKKLKNNISEYTDEYLDSDLYYLECTVISVKCFECNIKFNSFKELKAHLIEKHNRYFLQCSFVECEETFKTSNQLLNHTLDIHNNVRYWHCKFCSFGNINSLDLIKHYIWFHFKGIFKCNLCSKISITLINASDHYFSCYINTVRKQNNKEEWICKKILHLKSITSCKTGFGFFTFSRVCKICNQMILRELYQDHLRFNHRILEQEIICGVEDCLYIFKDKHEYYKHIDEDHNNLKCDKCNLQLENINSFIQHVQMVHEFGTFICSFKNCKQTYSTKSGALLHYKEAHRV